MTKTVLFLVGPTASGKTELALCLSRRLGCEVIAADSMQVYKGMNIGTAKPSLSQRRQVRHHLIDLVSPRSHFSVYRHRERALRAIQDIFRRGKIPLVVGGSGLYLDALRKGLSEIPGSGRKISAPRGGNLRSAGSVSLHDELARMDPLRAREIHPHDRRRILRALEIAKSSGKLPTDWYGQRKSLEDLGYAVRVFGIARDRTDLYERINQRVLKMFRRGFLAEANRLKKAGFSRTARQALGYREILEFLEGRHGAFARNDCLNERIALIQKHTRQFAKRQLSWFRREKEIRWIPWRKGESAARVCDKITEELGTG